MNEQVAAAFQLLPGYLSQHVLLSASALAIALLVSLPLAFAVASRPRARTIALSTARIVQTIPGLALIALFYPFLLLLSSMTIRFFGFPIPSLGFLPALLALVTFAILPILQGGVLGLTSIDADVLEAADAVGMTRRQRLRLVEIPLAAPIVMAGVRTAAVWTIGAATLATPVGQTSLGNYIFSGLQTENWVFVILGCVAAAFLALAVDASLSLVERGLQKREARRAMVGVALLAIGLVVSLAAAPARTRTYVVGAKNFSEQFILAELIGGSLRANGLPVTLRTGLGSAVIFRALAAGDLDVYVDYSGTLWANVMNRSDSVPRAEMLSQITSWMRERGDVEVLGPLGFENAYGLVMRKEKAAKHGVKTIQDLAAHAPSFTFGADLEFLARPEWRKVRDTYNLSFRESRTFDPTLMYRALQSGDVDVISGFSSDGRIAALDLVVLEDPAGALPNYDALLLISNGRAGDARFQSALRPLIDSIDIAAMRAANHMVDREADKMLPAQAAKVLREERLSTPAPAQ